LNAKTLVELRSWPGLEWVAEWLATRGGADGDGERAPRLCGNAQDRAFAVVLSVADEDCVGRAPGAHLYAVVPAAVAVAGLAPAGACCWLFHVCSASVMTARDSAALRA
jgi:hypothetical protein